MSFPPAEALTSIPKIVRSDRNKSSNDLGNFPVYTLVPLSDEDAFLKAVNEDDIMNYQQVFFPPVYDFSGKTLADILNYHLEELMPAQKREEENGGRGKFTIDPFLVAIHDDYMQYGVLLINMFYEYYDDTQAAPAICRAPVQVPGEDHNQDIISAVSWCANLAIANMDMYEMLENDEDASWPAELPGYAQTQAELKQSAVTLKREARERLSRLPIRRVLYSVHQIGNVGVSQHNLVEPDYYYKDDLGLRDHFATVDGVNSRLHRLEAGEAAPSIEQLWQVIRREHPGRCATSCPLAGQATDDRSDDEEADEEQTAEVQTEDQDSKPMHESADDQSKQTWTTHKFWMFVYDNAEGVSAQDLDVALVKVKWDGDVDGKTKEELEQIMPELEVVERVKPKDALKRMDELSGYAVPST